MINAAAAALFASDVPVIAPAAAVRVAKLEGSAWSVCPDVGQLEKAKLVRLLVKLVSLCSDGRTLCGSRVHQCPTCTFAMWLWSIR